MHNISSALSHAKIKLDCVFRHSFIFVDGVTFMNAASMDEQWESLSVGVCVCARLRVRVCVCGLSDISFKPTGSVRLLAYWSSYNKFLLVHEYRWGSAGLCDLCWEGEPKHFNVCAVPVLSRLSSFNNRGDDPKGNVSPTSALPLLLRDEMESILLPDPVLT